MIDCKTTAGSAEHGWHEGSRNHAIDRNGPGEDWTFSAKFSAGWACVGKKRTLPLNILSY